MLLKFMLLAALLLLAPLCIFAGDAPQKYMQVRVLLDSPDQMLQLQKEGVDLVWSGDKYVEIITHPDQLSHLQDLGYKTATIHEDVEEFYRSRLASKPMGGYKTLSQLETELFFLNYIYPNIVGPMISIGKTIENRDIWAIKISDNPNVDEDEPEILFTAAHHCREVVTPEIILAIMNHLTQNYGVDPEVTNLVDNREIWFVLVVNPDGYAYNDLNNPGGGGMWRKNRRDNGDGSYGVDLNRNYGYMWGYDDIGSSPNTATETYRGSGPFSEAETQAVRDLIIAHHFEIVINYHAYSNLILWPYGYAVGTYTPDEKVFNALGQRLSSYNNYTADPAWAMYPVNGDVNDWAYAEQTLKEKCFGYTIEAGNYLDGFWPPVSRIPEITAENLPGSLFLISLAGDVNSIAPPETPSLTSPDSIPGGGSYSVDWSLYDTINPPVNYELLEMQDLQTGTDSANNFNSWLTSGYVLSNTYYHSSGSSFHSGTPSLAFRYVQSTTPYLVKPNDTLKFWTYYFLTETWDFAWVEVSTNGTTFFTIPGNLTIANNYFYHNRGHGITGNSGDWVEGRFDLSAFVGQEIYVRFSYKDHDLYYAGQGIYIDDISPISGFETTTVLSSSLTDTSYAISGRPDGIYYYKVRAKDAENQWGVFSNISQTTVGSPYVCGDANKDKIVNIKDITYLINFLYKGGLAPDPMQAGDANGDGIVNIRDVTYLINYLYKGGPIPICPPN
jgi:hypothetical protein